LAFARRLSQPGIDVFGVTMIFCPPAKCALCLLIPGSDFCLRLQARRYLELSKRVVSRGVHDALAELGLDLNNAARAVEPSDWTRPRHMPSDQTVKAACPKCGNDMIYVAAMPHRAAPQMQRTTFVCYTCNRTRSYMLSAEMSAAYAAVAAVQAPAWAGSVMAIAQSVALGVAGIRNAPWRPFALRPSARCLHYPFENSGCFWNLRAVLTQINADWPPRSSLTLGGTPCRASESWLS
jgi:DNA-directed RNA polymerase subunit M/transcription elongation factor TFIIS